jgi:hypothetical protein
MGRPPHVLVESGSSWAQQRVTLSQLWEPGRSPGDR